MIRLETRLIDAVLGYEDALGYLRCLDCAGPEQRGTAYTISRLGDYEDETCNECGKSLEETRREPIYAEVPVEYVSCRIF